jgi:predicted RNA-binding protein with PUA-like domain
MQKSSTGYNPAVAHWLLKTEPGDYSYDDLVRDKRATWDGVSNALALRHLRDMRKGDLAYIYHTGKEREIVGVAEIASNPAPDPRDEKLIVIDLTPKRRLSNPVTLEKLKSDARFNDFALIRIGRLSVMPVPADLWDAIQALSRRA